MQGNAAQDAQFQGTGTGGAIYATAGANVRINASTIAFNSAKTSGGAIDRADAPGSVVSLANTIVAQNTAEQPFGNCRQPVASAGYNLVGDVAIAYSCLGGAQTTDQFATDALLVRVPDFKYRQRHFRAPIAVHQRGDRRQRRRALRHRRCRGAHRCPCRAATTTWRGAAARGLTNL